MNGIEPIALHSHQPLKAEERKSVSDLNDDSRSKDIQLRAKSKELEAVFLTQMIKTMEKTIPEGMMGSKNGLPSMLFSSVLGDAVAGGGGVGLSDMIYASLRQQNEVSAEELDSGEFLNALQAVQMRLRTAEE